MLPVRPVLPDQMPLCAAARVEPGFPAHHVARQGDQVPKGRGWYRREAAGLDRPARPLCRHPNRVAGGERRQSHQGRAQRDGRRGRRRQKRLATGPGHAQIPKQCAEGQGYGGQGRRQDPGQGGDLCHLLHQLQRAGHRPRPAQDPRPQRGALCDRRERKMLRHAQARTR